MYKFGHILKNFLQKIYFWQIIHGKKVLNPYTLSNPPKVNLSKVLHKSQIKSQIKSHVSIVL